jgi:autotransporter-associated beta strand protein
VGSAGTFDVSQNPTFTLNQTLSGSGTVTGLLVAASGTISPGGVGAAGTLTFLSGLTENGGINNQMELSTPTGTDDLISVTGNLTLSGVNNIQLSAFGGGTIPVGIYPLITYTGTLSGGPANFAVTAVGVSGIVTNITTTTPPEIAVIVSAAVRGATNLTWKGDGVLNNWDTTSSNWFNGPTSFAFQAGDQVLFNDAGTPNTNVNLGITVLPASVAFSNTLHYTISGSGNIGGSGGLTKTNSGITTILTTNSYTGPTIVGQGVLEIGNVAVSGANSSLGAATGNPTNLVFFGTTLKYSGPSDNTDRGATLNGFGATFDVTNGTTLTLNGSITGPGALALTDSGTLVLGNPNTYNGGTIISNGILALGSNNANNNGSGGSGVGPTNEPVTFNGGTLKLFGNGGSDTPNYSTFYNPLVVPAGQSGTLLMFPRGPINTGSGAGLNSPLSGGGTLTVEANYVRDALSGDWSAFTGTIIVTNFNAAGGDEFRINNNFGYANATIDLVGSVIMDSALSANATIDIGELDGATNAVIGPGNASQPGPTWSIGWKNTSSTYLGLIEDDNTTPGGHTSLTKVGTGTLTLVGGIETILNGLFPETLATNFLEYSGSTTISNGTLAIIIPDALSLSSNVTLAASSAVLDASQMGFVDPNSGDPVTNSVFEVVSGQTLAGIGTIRGFLVTDPGSTFNVGLPGSTGTMTVTNAVTLNGTTQIQISRGSVPNVTELISDAAITNSGALIVTNIGGTLQGGDTFTLFHATSYVGTFSSVTLPTLSGSQSWNTANLYVNGTISVVGSAGGLSFSSIKTSGNNIVLSATGGTPGGPVSVLTTTNLLLPLSQWSTLTTGSFDSNGNYTNTVTGAVTSGLRQQFYLLQVP